MFELLAIFALLADPDYETREQATKHLAYLVDGWPWHYGDRVKYLAAKTSSPEAAFRCRAIIAGYDRWRINNYVPRTVPVWPCCDMMQIPMFLGDRPARFVTHPEPFGHNGANDCGPYWHRYRRGTEHMVRRLLADGATEAEVDALLARMWALELTVELAGRFVDPLGRRLSTAEVIYPALPRETFSAASFKARAFSPTCE